MHEYQLCMSFMNIIHAYHNNNNNNNKNLYSLGGADKNPM